MHRSYPRRPGEDRLRPAVAGGEGVGGHTIKRVMWVATRMDCPRCGATLETYSLSGRDASVCESCGYVGVPVEHTSEPEEFESWQDAIRRFYEGDAEEGKN